MSVNEYERDVQALRDYELSEVEFDILYDDDKDNDKDNDA